MRRLTLIVGLLLVVCTLPLVGVRADSGVSVTTLDTLRLHSKADLKSDTLANVPVGTTLPAISKDATAQWIKVSYQGQYGWLNVNYLKVNGNLASLPTGDILPPAPAANNGTPPPPANGTIATLNVYTATLRVTYYRLTYYSDGLIIKGWLGIPKGQFQKFPAIIYNRGGNSGSGLVGPVELAPFAETGYVTVASEYRGSPGSQGLDQFGGDDVDDVTSLIPLLENLPSVDPARIGMFGTSRGGMMTYLALKAQSQSGAHDIKVASTVSGLTDLILWASERSDLNASFYPAAIGTTTTQDPEPFKARSATYWAGSIRVPLLIQHGDADDQVGVEQATKLYQKMEAYGRVAKLIIYPGDGHGLHGNEAGIRATLRWFQPYLAAPGEDLTFETHADQINNAYLILRR